MIAHCIGSSSHSSHFHAHVSCVISLLVFLLLTRHLHSLPLLPHHLSDHPGVPSARQLRLPGCGGQIPCALPLRTLAPWPRTSLPQVMSPTTTSSQRLMSSTPRSPPASSGPPTTPTTMTSPSARRSLTRAEDEPITLKKKACRQSVMIERGDPLFAHLVHKFRASKKLRDTNSKVNRLGLSWNDKESRFSLTVKQRFENRNFRPITTEEVFKSWMKRSSRKREEICRAHQGDERRRQGHQLLHEQLLKHNWDLREAHEKSLIEAISRLNIRHNCEEIIG